MLRLLIILLVLYIAFTLTRRARTFVKKSQEVKKSDGKMVKCAICEVYLPAIEAEQNANGDFFCDRHVESSDRSNDSDSG